MLVEIIELELRALLKKLFFYLNPYKSVLITSFIEMLKFVDIATLII